MAPESKKHVGWVVSERFINMPMEIMPPMYNMMQEETKQAKQNASSIIHFSEGMLLIDIHE